jgi:hypothetical protein
VNFSWLVLKLHAVCWNTIRAYKNHTRAFRSHTRACRSHTRECQSTHMCQNHTLRVKITLCV